MHKIWTFSTLQRPTQEEKERRRKYREDQLLRERQHTALVNDTNKKVNRAKTFLHKGSPVTQKGGGNNSSSSNNDGGGFDYNDNEYGRLDSSLMDSLPSEVGSSANFIEALRHRARSASRINDHNKIEKQRNRYNYEDEQNYPKPIATRTLNRDTRKRESKSVGANPQTFQSRLRFLDRTENPRSNFQFDSSPPSNYNQQNQRFLRWQDQRDQLSSGYSSGGGGRATQEQEINSDDTADAAMDIYAMTTTMQRKKREKEMQDRSREIKPVTEQRGCGPSNGEMVSRRKILSRSRDDLHLDGPVPNSEQDEEDIWYNKEKLYKDHLHEVLSKWESIDDEIWAKIIVLERNRRVAKAYARAPVLTVNGTDDGFDGFRIGLAGFENPMRDPKTEEAKRLIGQGCKIKMDDSGNILVKRIAKSNVYVKNTTEENSISNDILKVPNAALEQDKPCKLFDMKKFEQNISREMKRSYPDRRRLEYQCISAIAFVRNEANILECPCWIMLINVVAMDMLKSKMPPVKNPRSAIDIRNRPGIPIPDEDPYSIAGSGSSGGSSGNGNGVRDRERSRPNKEPRPPELPPREGGQYGTKASSRPNYEHMEEQRFRQQSEIRGKHKKDDPYYCGLRARIPNFAKSKAQKEKEASKYAYTQQQQQQQVISPPSALPGQVPPHHPMMWHRGYLDNGKHLDKVQHHQNASGYGYAPGAVRNSRPFERNPTTWVPPAPMRNEYDSDYSHIYGRTPLPTRGFRQYPQPNRQIYVSEWE